MALEGSEIFILREAMETVKNNFYTAFKGLFRNFESACYAFIFNSKFTYFSLSKASLLDNLNEQRLTNDPFPAHNRPRGAKDMGSVRHFRALIRRGEEITPIWIVKKGKKYVLIDGVHRIVACLQEGLLEIPAYIVKADKIQQ
jgi:hypothetical protein